VAFETPFPGEDRQLVPSPRVATYDQSPETVRGPVLTASCIAAITRALYSLIVINYAT